MIRKLIAKSIPFYIRKKVPINILRHFYFSGTFTAFLHGKPVAKLVNEGYQIENEIYWKGIEGGLEGKSMELFCLILQIIKPKVIWDIGANTGTYGIIAKAISPDSSIYFFEPLTKAIEIIKANCEANNFKLNILNIALGDYNGVGELFLPKGKNITYGVTVNKNTVNNKLSFDKLFIQVKRADTLINNNNIEKPDFIKMDVESYEPNVLRGFGSILPLNCIYLIEILNEESVVCMNEFLSSKNFIFFNIDDKNKKFRETTNLCKSDFYNYLIIPKSFTNLINILNNIK